MIAAHPSSPEAIIRILHVASAFTPDNRFGGPTRVAIGLSRELQRRGHDVTIVGAGLDWERLPHAIDGVPARLVQGLNPIPFLGWASLLAPGLRRVVAQEAARADVVHVHLARDVVTLTGASAAKRVGTPYVVQTHGMIDAAGGPLARLVDAAATRRALAGAAVALPLTPEEAGTVGGLAGPGVPVELLPNGVDAAPEKREASGALFLARLHPRKGAAAFAHAAASLVERWPDVRFTIAGPDEGDGAAVRDALRSAGERVRVIGAVTPDRARALLAGSTLYVLPAEREPFGMTVIEAMSGGRPVVLHASAALAPAVIEAGAGWTFGPGGTHQSLEAAIDAALTDPAALEEAGRQAGRLVAERYSIGHVVDLLLQHYEETIAHRS